MDTVDRLSWKLWYATINPEHQGDCIRGRQECYALDQLAKQSSHTAVLCIVHMNASTTLVILGFTGKPLYQTNPAICQSFKTIFLNGERCECGTHTAAWSAGIYPRCILKWNCNMCSQQIFQLGSIFLWYRLAHLLQYNCNAISHWLLLRIQPRRQLIPWGLYYTPLSGLFSNSSHYSKTNTATSAVAIKIPSHSRVTKKCVPPGTTNADIL